MRANFKDTTADVAARNVTDAAVVASNTTFEYAALKGDSQNMMRRFKVCKLLNK